MARCLKDLPLRLQTHKLNNRREIFKDLTDLLQTQELSEKVFLKSKDWNNIKSVGKLSDYIYCQIIGGICRVLSVTLMRYCDSESRRLVLDFIRYTTI